uniref:Reverse transcriptase domain-containing protein n=1 Tax=Tanacetum cinerariifolium TaxID=118510 RepID=A0A6L2K040_TANCI|nr:reverse transcriptase domain-containing protein [Tanacetum cinerariifolium]
MTNGREDTSPPGFLTLTPLPGLNVGKLPPITTSTFTARSPENTPLANRASTSANPDPVISPAFVEPNYEVLGSLLRDRRRQVYNEGLHTKLDYYSEEYDEERERDGAKTGTEEYDEERERDEAKTGMGAGLKGNLMAGGLRNREQEMVNPYSQPNASMTYGQPPGYLFLTPIDSTSCMTPFVRWIKDYPILDGLKMPSHVGSYDGKRDPDNYLHLFEDDTLQILGLHEEQRISSFVHGLKTRSLVEFLSTDLPTTYKGLMEKTYIWIEAKEFATNRTSIDHKEGFNSCADTKDNIIVNAKYPKQKVIIRKQLPTSFKRKLQDLLRSNTNAFAWNYADMTGNLRTIMVGGNPFNTEHKLNEYKHITPVKQKKRGLAPEQNKAACKEVDELMKAGILREVKDQTWVANPVMVKKSDRDWRMCVDFTDINKACLKDCYPLLEIDWNVESLLGFQLKCFLDAYKGYHQIQTSKGDEDKTTFFTRKGVFCYWKMPFGLKNARATY